MMLGAALAAMVLMTADTFADKATTDKAPTDDQTAIIANLKQTLQTRLPTLQIDSIEPSQWPFFYEVMAADGELFYVDKTGDYLFLGKVMDTKTRTNLTEQRWNALNQVDFKSLPFDLAVKEVRGDGSRKIAVFADPHCPYCSRFVKTLQDVNNITVYTFLFPLEDLHPGATERAKKIWCANNRETAWEDWMLKQQDTPATACNTGQLKTIKTLGEKLKINGTPTLIFPDGDRIPGAIGKDDLEKQLQSESNKKS